MIMTTKTLAGFSSAVAAILLAFLGAYVSLRQEVYARPTDEQVRQLIDDKTTDKFFEVFRRFDKLDGRFDRLEDKLNRRSGKDN